MRERRRLERGGGAGAAGEGQAGGDGDVDGGGRLLRPPRRRMASRTELG